LNWLRIKNPMVAREFFTAKVLFAFAKKNDFRSRMYAASFFKKIFLNCLRVNAKNLSTNHNFLFAADFPMAPCL